MKMMKMLLVLCIVFFVSAMMVNATQYNTGMNWDTTFDLPAPQKANDYHIQGKVQSVGNVEPTLTRLECVDDNAQTVWGLIEYTINKSSETDTWEFSIHFEIGNGKFIESGDTCHFGFEFKTDTLNHIDVTGLLWTLDGVEIGKDKVTGFYVWDNPAKATIISFDNRLTDILTRPIDIAEIQFAVTDYPITLADMSRNGLGFPGIICPNPLYANIRWISYPRRLHIEPRSFVSINLTELGVHLGEGQYLHARYMDTETREATWIQHQHSTMPLERVAH